MKAACADLGASVQYRYIEEMDHAAHGRKPYLVGAVTLFAAAVAAGVAFAGWSRHGADIFVNMAATGLAWCL